MSTKAKIFLGSLLGIILLATICFSMYAYYSVSKIVVIDVIKTLDQFKMKKDLEAQAEPKLYGLKNKVDSLYGMVEYAVTNKSPNVKNLHEEYQFWQDKMYQAYESSNKAINEQVWKRLNPMIDEFGKINDYRIVIGANGMGTVLYNADVIDATNDLILFINKQYGEGGK